MPPKRCAWRIPDIVAADIGQRGGVHVAFPQEDVHVGAVRNVAEVEVAGVLRRFAPLDKRAVLRRVRGEVFH